MLHLCSGTVPGILEMLEGATVGSLANIKDGVHKCSESSTLVLSVLQMVCTPGVYQDIIEVNFDPGGVVRSVEHLCLQP